MLFVVQEDLAPFCTSAGGSEIEGLQNLLLSTRRGEHAMIASPIVLELLAKNESLGARERSMAKYLLSKKAEINQLLGLVQNKVYVHADRGRSLRRDRGDWFIGAAELATKFTSKVILLAENMVDAELYEIAANHYRVIERLKGVGVSVLCRGGGGSQLDVELNANLSAGLATVVLSDGDKFYPNQPLSEVAQRCRGLVESGIGLSWHHSLSCYSAENLVPPALYSEVCESEDRHSECERVSLIDLHSRPLGHKASMFFSWKTGINLSDIFEFSDQNKRIFWNNVVSSINSTTNCMHSRCVEEGVCQLRPCKCVLANGFGKNCLRLVSGWIKDRGIHESSRIFKDSEEWMSIGKLVFEVGLSFPPQRI